jgi:hypothetical protein
MKLLDNKAVSKADYKRIDDEKNSFYYAPGPSTAPLLPSPTPRTPS